MNYNEEYYEDASGQRHYYDDEEEVPIIDYHSECEELRELIDRLYRRIHANPGTAAAQKAYFLIEDAAQLWQEFYSRA